MECLPLKLESIIPSLSILRRPKYGTDESVEEVSTNQTYDYLPSILMCQECISGIIIK